MAEELAEAWASRVGNCADCFREPVVRERVVLLRRTAAAGAAFEDAVAARFEPQGSPELVLKANRNAVLEAARQRLLARPPGAYALARLRLDARFYDRATGCWPCYMTSDFCAVAGPHACLRAYARKTQRVPVDPLDPPDSEPEPERTLAPPSAEHASGSAHSGSAHSGSAHSGSAEAVAEAVAEAAALRSELAAERSARAAQDARIARLESQVATLAARLDATRAAVENFRAQHLDRKRPRED